MTTYYADTSALVKRYGDEVGSGWFRTILDQFPPVLATYLIRLSADSADLATFAPRAVSRLARNEPLSLS